MIGSGEQRGRVHRRRCGSSPRRAPSRTTPSCCASSQTIEPGATEVADWQKTWLENLVKKERYEVDASEVRQYFPYDRVLAGLLEITSEIFDLALRARSTTPSVWHPSVLVYDVVRGADKLGRIYLDMHPRDGKYKHAAQFPLKDGVRGVAAPRGRAGVQLPRSGGRRSRR